MDTCTGTFRVPADKWKKVQSRLDSIVLARYKPVGRTLSSMLGMLSSLHVPLGQVRRLYTRELYRCLGSPSNLNRHVKLDLAARDDI